MEELAHNMNEYGLCLAVSATMPSKNTNILGMLDASHLSEASCKQGFAALRRAQRGHGSLVSQGGQ